MVIPVGSPSHGGQSCVGGGLGAVTYSVNTNSAMDEQVGSTARLALLGVKAHSISPPPPIPASLTPMVNLLNSPRYGLSISIEILNFHLAEVA